MIVRCFHCNAKFVSGEAVLNHAYAIHHQQDLAILIQQTGNQYLPNFCPWKPSNHLRSLVNLDEDQWKIICKSSTEILSSPPKKVAKLSSSPQKASPSTEMDTETCHTSDVHLDHLEVWKSDLTDYSNGIDEVNKRICDSIPTMTDFFLKEGRLDSWINFIKCVKNHTFPQENIALHLFLDVADWYGCDSVNVTRYSDKVKKFWCMGYKIFRERFLWFT